MFANKSIRIKNKFSCLICCATVSGGDSNQNDVTFVLRILLEIAQSEIKNELSSLLSFKSFNICDQCNVKVSKAKEIYTELVKTTQKFRALQKEVVEIFKTTKESADYDKKEDNPFKLCRQLVNGRKKFI